MGFDTALFASQPVGSHLICAICQDVHQKPTTACDNGHVYCEACIATWLAKPNGNKCPDCRLPVHTKRGLCRPLEAVIMALNVCCPKKHEQPRARGREEKETTAGTATASSRVSKAGTIDRYFTPKRARIEAAPAPPPATNLSTATTSSSNNSTNIPTCCGWEGTLSDYQNNHSVSECFFTKKPCFLCYRMIALPALEDHKKNLCLRRTVVCTKCQATVLACNQEEHLRLRCPEIAVTCRGCQNKFLRKDLGTVKMDATSAQGRIYTGHFAVCHKLHVPCLFAQHGCTAFVKREDMDDHCKLALEAHSKLLNKALVKSNNPWKEIEFGWNIPRHRINTDECIRLLSMPYKKHGMSFRMEMVTCNSNPESEVIISIYVVGVDGGEPIIDGLKISLEGTNSVFCERTESSAMEYDMEPPFCSDDQVYCHYTALKYRNGIRGVDSIDFTANLLESVYGTSDYKTFRVKFHIKPATAEFVAVGCYSSDSD